MIGGKRLKENQRLTLICQRFDSIINPVGKNFLHQETSEISLPTAGIFKGKELIHIFFNVKVEKATIHSVGYNGRICTRQPVTFKAVNFMFSIAIKAFQICS